MCRPLEAKKATRKVYWRLSQARWALDAPPKSLSADERAQCTRGEDMVAYNRSVRDQGFWESRDDIKKAINVGFLAPETS